MKRLFKKILLTTIILSIFLLSSCTKGSKEIEDSTQENYVQENNVIEDTKEEEIMNKKTLVVYFSREGEQYNVGVINKGNTEIVAEIVAEKTNGDLFEVEALEDNYPLTYKELCDYAQEEANNNARPEYVGELLNLDEYDTIFFGSPVWWGDWPMIMYTVFENNDFSNKKLIPFSTHEGSGLSGFDSKLKSACPNSEILEGQAFRGSDTQNNKEKVSETVDSWISKIGY